LYMILVRTLALAVVVMAAGALPARAAHLSKQTTNTNAVVTVNLWPASPAMAACLPDARAQVTITPGPANDTLALQATGLPPFAGFYLFATSAAQPPYGFTWPLSVVQADAQGAVTASAQALLLGAYNLSGAAGQVNRLVLFFANAGDAAQCTGAGSAQTTSLANGDRIGPAALISGGTSNPLAAPPYAPPGLGISTPSMGRSVAATPVTFTVACSDPQGWAAIRFIDFRLTSPDTGTVVFWARLDRPAKRLYLYDPSSGRWLGGMQPGSAATLSTSLVQLALQSSKVLGTTGSTGRVLLTLSFSTRATGQSFAQSVRVTDLRSQTRGWNSSGTWTID
jgi:hypothetical protein